MPVPALVFLLGGYLSGSVPTAYLIARWRRGIDIRQVGSGNVGGSNLRATVGVWATVAVGLFDVAKGALPVWLAQWAGQVETTAILAGLVAVVGHNWSVWLGLQGGRGIATTLGLLLAAFPAGVLWVLASLAIGALAHEVALLNGLGVLTLPLLSVWLNETAPIKGMSVALVMLMIAKRLEANQRFKPHNRRVWLNRLVHDRDEI